MHDYKRAQAITIPRQTVLQHDAWRLRAQTFLTKSAAYFGFILVAIGELFQILCILHFVRLLLLNKDSYKRVITRQDGPNRSAPGTYLSDFLRDTARLYYNHFFCGQATLMSFLHLVRRERWRYGAHRTGKQSLRDEQMVST